MTTTDPDRRMFGRFLSVKEAAALIGLSSRTLDRYRHMGTGPVFYKLGTSIRYREDDLRTWLEEHRMKPTRRRASPASQ